MGKLEIQTKNYGNPNTNFFSFFVWVPRFLFGIPGFLFGFPRHPTMD
jgi:hypothetical protein